jgi:hypothetical protein
MTIKKRDWLLFGLVAIIVLVLWAAPDETTKRIPDNAIHHRFFDIIAKDGKKAAEKFCEECHNKDNVPFPANHPPKFRCLFCHKLENR